jgi:hypothetical protein
MSYAVGAATVAAVAGAHAGALATLRNGTYLPNKCISETACEIICVHVSTLIFYLVPFC